MNQECTSIITQNQSSEDIVKKIEHYLFKWSNSIGKGSFSQVYLGINQNNQQPVAIKLIKNTSLSSKTAQRLLNHQISILKHLDHPNIIKCQDVLISLHNCYIITQYCSDGDLGKILKQKKFFMEQQISKIIYDIYKGLQYLNQNFIVHRDLKIANIFLSHHNYKIADFGFAIRSKSLFADIAVGSPIYMSPEGLINNNYGPKTDVWSFGIMIYELLHGETPLDKCKTEDELKINVMKTPQIKAQMSDQLTQLLQRCLEPNVSKRISVPQIKETNYLKKIFSIFQKSIISQKLVSTYHSTQTNYSVTGNLFDRCFADQQALAILHYCRLLHKTSLNTGCKDFALWLLLIFQGFAKCKIIGSTQQKSPRHETSNKSQYQNLKQVIIEYHLKYKKQHNQLKLTATQLPNFDSILSECTRLYQQYKQKTIMSDLKIVVLNLYKETQILNQSFKKNDLQYFVKHSQARKFLSLIGK